MEISMHEELKRGFDLLNNGKDEEALELLKNFEKQEDLTPEDMQYYKLFKGTLLLLMARLPESLKISEDGYQECLSQNKILFAINNFVVKWSNFLALNRGY